MQENNKPFSLYLRKRKKGKPVYYARFRLLNGKRSTGKNTGQTSKGAAERWAWEYLNKGQIVINENVTLAEFSVNFFDWSGDWAVDLKATRKRISKRQCIEKASILNNRIIPALGTYKLTHINKAVIKTFRNDLYRQGFKGSSINKTLSCLRAILEAAEEKQLIQAVPKIERVAGNNQQRGILTPEEVKQLFSLEWPDFRVYVANMTAASTGLRQGEILGLQRKNIKEGYLEILKSWEQVIRELNQTTKTGRERFCPLPERVETLIKTLLDLSPWKTPDSFIFFSTNRPDKPIEGRALTKGLYKALLKIGIDQEQRKKRRIDFHSWHHWFNSFLINKRVPLQKIQALTGHLTDEMTANYYHVDDMADVRDLLDTVFIEDGG